jgi:hypothetical protein
MKSIHKNQLKTDRKREEEGETKDRNYRGETEGRSCRLRIDGASQRENRGGQIEGRTEGRDGGKSAKERQRGT